MYPRPFLKPTCSFLNYVSMALSMHLRNILQNILLGPERKVIPLQLLQLQRSPPFFGSLNIRPCPWAVLRNFFLFPDCMSNRSVNTLADVHIN